MENKVTCGVFAFVTVAPEGRSSVTGQVEDAPAERCDMILDRRCQGGLSLGLRTYVLT